VQGIKLLLAVALTVAAACDHQPRRSGDEARERWNQLQPEARAQVAELRSRQTVIGGRIGALALPPGTWDHPLTQQFTALQAGVGSLEAPIAAFEADASAAAAEIDAAFAGRDRVRARRAVERATAELAASYAAAKGALDAIEAQLDGPERALQRHLEAHRFERERYAGAADRGGTLVVAVQFRGGGPELVVEDTVTRASLERLVQMTRACPQLRVTLAAHVAEPETTAARALGLARAASVRAYLVAAGVAPEVLSMTPAPSPPAQAGEHVLVTVTTPCAAPSAIEPVPPPAAAVPPSAPGHEGHGH
jgi:outer membrane protein OmpA-like peptidoglycan-associated protein